jgi:large subunit ribosomal protein L15
MMLHELNELTKKRKRVGRGGSRGGHSGRGETGQKSRSGVGLGLVFEGGQMPLTRRLPKRGFSNARFKKVVEILNLTTLEAAFDAGATITREELIARGLVRGATGATIKLLGKGEVSKRFVVHVDACSASARQAIVARGGEVVINQES